MVTELAHRRRGLPLLPVPDGNAPVPFPTEAQLIAQTTGAVQVLYDQLKRGQDSVAVVTNLLNSADPRCPNSPSHMDGQRRLLDEQGDFDCNIRKPLSSTVSPSFVVSLQFPQNPICGEPCRLHVHDHI
ncbi:hypothetical protein FB451DRAFT_1417337 [Mycena latifolia]|nr:hypothetical protein FB451DRAFT_1417337 [Mycena latifolia]